MSSEKGATMTLRIRTRQTETFVAMLAHEFSQPLDAILHNSEAALHELAARKPRSQETRKTLRSIRGDALRARELCREIRDVIYQQKLVLSPTDLNTAIREAIALATGYARHSRVRIDAELEPDLPAILGNEHHLTRVFLNLLNNGIDSTMQRPARKRRLHVTSCFDGGLEIVTVHDTGKGIAKENAQRVFDFFFTTKKQGMGLGLSIAQSIVQMHKGSIWCEDSDRSEGAAMRVAIPVAQDRNAHKGRESAPDQILTRPGNHQMNEQVVLSHNSSCRFPGVRF
jgi:signal transduction histidine kinase